MSRYDFAAPRGPFFTVTIRRADGSIEEVQNVAVQVQNSPAIVHVKFGKPVHLNDNDELTFEEKWL